MKMRVIKFPEVEELERQVGCFHQHEWREDEEQIIEKYYGKMNTTKLAKYFGVSTNSLMKKANSMGLSYKDIAREMQRRMKQNRKK